jgi:hypothetical protein
MQPLLKWKTQSRFWPLNWSLSMLKLYSQIAYTISIQKYFLQLKMETCYRLAICYSLFVVWHIHYTVHGMLADIT